MKVKIGKKIYDSNEEPIMLILDGTDKQNISKMTIEQYKKEIVPREEAIEQYHKMMKNEW